MCVKPLFQIGFCNSQIPCTNCRSLHSKYAEKRVGTYQSKSRRASRQGTKQPRQTSEQPFHSCYGPLTGWYPSGVAAELYVCCQMMVQICGGKGGRTAADLPGMA